MVHSFGARLPVVAGARRDAERAFMEGLERELRDGLARCDRHVMSGEGAFHALLPPRRAQVVPFAGRFLAQLGDRHA